MTHYCKTRRSTDSDKDTTRPHRMIIPRTKDGHIDLTVALRRLRASGDEYELLRFFIEEAWEDGWSAGKIDSVNTPSATNPYKRKS